MRVAAIICLMFAACGTPRFLQSPAQVIHSNFPVSGDVMCEPINDDVWLCTDDTEELSHWRCVFSGGQWECKLIWES